MGENEICKGYCGVACIDGSCPIANRDEYAERGYDIVRECSECIYYKGCEDCCFDGDAQYCPKFTNENEKEIEGEQGMNTFDNRCSDCKYYKNGQCTHPNQMYCENCSLWTPNWHQTPTQKGGG